MSAAVFVAVIAFGLACVGALAMMRALAFGYPPPVVEKGSLTRREQAVVAACADALFPAGGPIPLSGTQAGLVGYMDAYVARSPRRSALLIRVLLAFVEYGPCLFGPRRVRFTRLSPADRQQVLVDMADSRIYLRRIAFLSIRTILSMGYLANDAVAASIGMRYDRAPFERVRASDRPPSVPPPAGVAA